MGLSRLVQPPHKPAGSAVAAPVPHGIRFEEVASRSGVVYRWNPKPRRPLRNRDAFGAGCAFVDFNNDGLQDIMLAGDPHCALFLNTGGGTFTDASAPSGLRAFTGPWTGCAWGDYDGDGWQDLLITGYHRLLLLRNEKGTRLSDVTARTGLSPHNWGNWGSGAGFMDLDADNDLDLVLLNYVVSKPGIKEYCELEPGVLSGCPPSQYQPEFGRLFRNDGGKHLVDVTARSGFQRTHGKGLVVGFCDADDDGRIDFYVGNDGTPAEFMRNLGKLWFRNIGLENGTAYGEMPGHSLAAMGVDWADYDRDGRMDFAVSAFSDESYELFHNDGAAMFSHTGGPMGIAGITFKPLGFGTKFADVDNDGWSDLIFANGHVYDNATGIDPLTSFRQPLMLLQNQQGRRYVDLAPVLGPPLTDPLLGRGLATGDYDNDGLVDLLVVDFEGTPRLLRNRSTVPGNWITLDLRGRGRNLFAYGAQVSATKDSERWTGQVSPGSSYLSSSDHRVHFGLGPHEKLENVEIRWPDGERQAFRELRAGRIHVIKQGKRIPSD
jgi:enediyne biosynthesis protein E4